MANKLNNGDPCPEFSLLNAAGERIESKTLIGKQPLVIYFYPADDTPGCTAEACTFRDQYEDFRDAGAEVIGISQDSVESHQQFAAKHRLPFTLLSDPDGQVAQAFGVKKTFGLLPGRVTFVVDQDGLIRHSFSSQLRAKQHVSEALEIIQNLNKK